jgi:hypothetical protein
MDAEKGWFGRVATANHSFNPTGVSIAFIEKLPLPQLSSGGLIRAFGGALNQRRVG